MALPSAARPLTRDCAASFTTLHRYDTRGTSAGYIGAFILS